jgi:galactokinase
VVVVKRRASIPARINIIGEHTDYLGGLALPFASGHRLVLTATQAEKTSGDQTVVDLWRAAGGWPATLAIESTIPIGAGMSSSAALCLAIVLCAQGSQDALAACKEAQRIEHQVLKTPCGLLDQMAMMMSAKGHAVLIDFSTMDHKPFLIPNDWMFKLVDSGIRRQLSETEFGASSDPHMLSQHVTQENLRVRQALDASSFELGTLLNASHASLQSIGVSTPEIDDLVAHLQSTPGVLGARMMGGGFGGMILVAVNGSEVLPEAPLISASQCGFLEEGFE